MQRFYRTLANYLDDCRMALDCLAKMPDKMKFARTATVYFVCLRLIIILQTLNHVYLHIVNDVRFFFRCVCSTLYLRETQRKRTLYRKYR